MGHDKLVQRLPDLQTTASPPLRDPKIRLADLLVPWGSDKAHDRVYLQVTKDVKVTGMNLIDASSVINLPRYPFLSRSSSDSTRSDECPFVQYNIATTTIAPGGMSRVYFTSSCTIMFPLGSFSSRSAGCRRVGTSE